MIFIYLISLFFTLYTFFLMARRSEFGILVIASEFLSIAVGLCIYPIFYQLDWITLGKEGYSFVRHNGEPSIITAFHILLYTASGCVGYLVATKQSYVGGGYLFRSIQGIVKSEDNSFCSLIIFGFVVYSIYFYLVGFHDSLINASAARSGEFDGFGENVQYLFLKTLANVSLYAVCFLPAILYKKTKRLWVLAYTMLVLIAYLNSISRSLLLNYIFVPFLVYSMVNFGFVAVVRITTILFIGSLVLFYGKPFGHYMSNYLTGNYSEILSYNTEYGYFNAIFNNFEFAWFSVEAGVKNYYYNGPLIPDDLLYSPIGFIPSRFLEYIGLGEYSYGNATVRLPCVNANTFGFNDCTIPPLMSGYSAYLMPLVGGLIFGFIKFYIYGRLEKMWIFTKKLNYQLTWVPYFLFIISSNYFSLIPGAIAQSSLVIFSVFFIRFIRRFLVKTVSLTTGINGSKYFR